MLGLDLKYNLYFSHFSFIQLNHEKFSQDLVYNLLYYGKNNHIFFDNLYIIYQKGVILMTYLVLCNNL